MSYWLRRLPLGACLTGEPKGRTVRAMSEAAMRASSKEDEATAANLVKQYEGQCKLVGKIHPRFMDSVPYVDFKPIMMLLAQQGAEVPEKVTIKFLQKRLASLASSASYHDFWRAVDPWSPATDFKPDAVVSSVLADQTQRFSTLQRCAVTRVIVPLIMHGDTATKQLKECVEAGMEVLGDCDVVQLDDFAAEHYENVSIIFKGLQALLNLECDEEQAEALSALKASASTKGSGPKLLRPVGAAVEAVPFFQQRMDTLLRIQAPLQQHHCEIVRAKNLLAKVVSGDWAATDDLVNICSAYRSASVDLPSDVLAPLSEPLLAFLKQHFKDLSPKLASENVLENVSGALSLFGHAAQCFPMEDEIALAVREFNERISTMDGSKRVDKLEKVMKSIGDEGFNGKSVEEKIELLVEGMTVLQNLVGVEVPAKIELDARAAVAKRFGFTTAENLDSDDGKGLYDKYMALLSLVVDSFPNPHDNAFYELAVCSHTLRSRLQAIKGSFERTMDFANGRELADFVGLLERVKFKRQVASDKATVGAHNGQIDGATLLEVSGKLVGESSKFAQEAKDMEGDLKKKDFADSYNMAKNMFGVGAGSPKWWSKAPGGFGADMKALEEVLNNDYPDCDPKELKAQAKILFGRAAAYEAYNKAQGLVQMPDALLEVPEMVVRMYDLAAACQLCYLFKKAAVAKDDVRRYVQEEVLDFRTVVQGPHEKKYFPTAIYTAALAIIRKRADSSSK